VLLRVTILVLLLHISAWACDPGTVIAIGTDGALTCKLLVAGRWQSGTAYVPNDIVTDAGSTYISVLGGINHEPPNATYWTLLGSSGGGNQIKAESYGFSPANSGVANLIALQTAMTAAAGRTLTFGSVGTVDVEGTVAVPSNLFIQGNGTNLVIRQTAVAAQPLFLLTSVSDVTVDNLYVYGPGVWTNAITNNRDAFKVTASTNIRFFNNTIRNFGGIGIAVDSQTGFFAQGNTIEGTWVLGVNSSGQGCDTLRFCQGSGATGEIGIRIGVLAENAANIRIIGNEIYNTQFAIIGGGDNFANPGHGTIAKNFVISENIIHDIQGQHGMYVSGSNLVISGNSVSKCFLDGIKVINESDTPNPPRAWAITGNTITEALGNGIELGMNSGTTDLSGVTVTGNTISDGGTGIAAAGLAASPNGAFSDLLIANNTLRHLTGEAVYLSGYVSRAEIKQNHIYQTIYHGILVASPANYISVESNDIYDSGSSTQYGIYIANATNVRISNNRVIDTRGGAAMYAGIFIGTAGASTTTVDYNYVRGATDYSIRLDSPPQSFVNNDTGDAGTLPAASAGATEWCKTCTPATKPCTYSGNGDWAFSYSTGEGKYAWNCP